MSEFSEYMRLLPYGYAPGNYMSKCFACEKVVADVDKRATSCRPCAETAFKDHEIERLRAEVAGLREFVEHVRRNGGTHLANMAIAVLAARKGDA